MGDKELLEFWALRSLRSPPVPGRRRGRPKGSKNRCPPRRLRVATGRVDLPLDPASVLLGRSLIDWAQFDKLGEIERLMRQTRAPGGAA